MSYDLRGNIITLQRNGLNSNGWTGNNFVAGTYGRIDNLTYAYNTKNQLLSVNEASLPTRGFKTNPNATGDQYGYDGNGNLTYDKNKYITSIEYNYLNLPIKVVIDNPDAVNSGSIEFIYDATGVKLRKTIKNKDGSVKETWDYVNGVEYKNRQLQRVAHSEGAVVQNEHGQYQHEYVLRDHLGNVRVTFRDGVNRGLELEDPNGGPNNVGIDPTYDDGVVTQDDIVQINHYYPFGLNMEGDWNGASGKNKYQYNGKEWNDDFGMGWYDYGARFYDPSIARWSTKDPLAEHYTNISLYTYVVNNPILFIDPTGMAVEEMADRTRYTGDDAKLAFMSIKAHVNAKNFNGNVLANLTSTVNKFGDEFSAAQEATKTDGYERGFVIYSDANGILHSSAMIKGTQKVISEEWVDELEKPTAKNVDVANLSLAGIYHTHTNTGVDNNPFSDGDIMQLFTNIQNGHYWNGTKRWTINTGFFVIADDVAGGRYAAVIEDFSKASSMNNRTRDQYNATFDDYVGSNNFAEGTAGQKARIFYGALFSPSTGIGIYHDSGNQSKNLNRINK